MCGGVNVITQSSNMNIDSNVRSFFQMETFRLQGRSCRTVSSAVTKSVTEKTARVVMASTASWR